MAKQSVLSVEQRTHYAVVFVKLDTNGDGSMCRTEFSRWLDHENLNLTAHHKEKLFRLFDLNIDGRITLDEFFSLMEVIHKPPNKAPNLPSVFQSMDKDGNQQLCKDEFTAGLQQCGYNFTDQQINNVMTKLDKDGNGKINYNEFISAFD